MKFLGSARLATKSQITLPKTVRDKLKLSKGDDLIFLQDENGLIYITKEVEIKILKDQE
ncbi:MAG: AbrB/MazE/SpoVT family DNA-binding domain-containing protein [Candidatus Heimdallarchaeota archaeon]